MAAISILGAGGWGLALSLVALRTGHSVTVWSPFENEVDSICNAHESRLLPGVKIPSEITVTSDLERVKGSYITIIATPSTAVRETAARLKGMGDCGIIVNVAKGIEYESTKRLSEVISDELPDASVCVLSGPSHAEEVARETETSLVASSRDLNAASAVQSAFSHDKLRIYTNDDIIGVELGGGLKNVIAIAAGFCDGMGLGDNTRAALITRGLYEMSRLGVAMGARESTFAGLTGMGDLIVTCTSRHSRNHRFGEMVGRGISVQKALDEVGTVEGYYAARTARKLSKAYKIDMPIVEVCYKAMYEQMQIGDAVKSLMLRPARPETEAVWFN